MREFLQKSWRAARLGWALVAVLLGLSYIKAGGSELLHQQLGVLAWKAVLVGVAVALAHVVRKQMLPYVDLSVHVGQDSAKGGLIFLGTCILYAAIILAMCSGL